MSTSEPRKLYATSVDEDGRRFSREPLWKGHRPVAEDTVEFYREVARTSRAEGERARAEAWLADYYREVTDE